MRRVNSEGSENRAHVYTRFSRLKLHSCWCSAIRGGSKEAYCTSVIRNMLSLGASNALFQHIHNATQCKELGCGMVCAAFVQHSIAPQGPRGQECQKRSAPIRWWFESHAENFFSLFLFCLVMGTAFVIRFCFVLFVCFLR